MAELSTLARPYAKAAFDYANENRVIEDWEQFLVVAKHIVGNESFKALLDNPAVSAEQKATMLVQLYDAQIAAQNNSALDKILSRFSGETKAASQPIKNFVAQLAEQERLALIPAIESHFRVHKSKALKHLDAYVTTAYPLTDLQRALIQTRLASAMNATIIMHEAVDPNLIAGATIKVGDKLVDDSVRGKLKLLKTQLTA